MLFPYLEILKQLQKLLIRTFLSTVGPGRKNISFNVEEEREGELLVSFKPMLVGEYLVDIRVGQEKIPGSPFR